MTAEDDARHMRHALGLGARGLGQTWPNPAVGCVIVNGGRIVGRGWTHPGGRPHAEVRALSQAGAAARGATAYVTLEPCAHHGHTPPCAEALIAAGVARVVTALTDPDPRVAGRGHAMLRAAGIVVTEGVEAAAAARAHRGFLARVTAGRPMVTLKLATSLDGRIATAAGESRWITGEAARQAVQALRAAHDAVMVGGGTARADDPHLTVRGMGPLRPPVRVVAARALDLPRGGRLQAADAPLWLAHDPAATPPEAAAHWQAAGARLLPVAAPGGRIDPTALVQRLGAEGLTRVFCEGGGAFAAALLGAGVVDELVLFTAGLALGAGGRPGLGPLAFGPLAAAPRFLLLATEVIGGDVMQRWEAVRPLP